MSGQTSSRIHYFTGRIGDSQGGGFYPAPHRYALHLALSCPAGLRIAITHSLLRLEDQVGLTLLPPVPGEGGDHPQLHEWYEASRHGYEGPAAAPVLTDGWTGRIVSDDPTHIVTDLATHFAGDLELVPSQPARLDQLHALHTMFDHDIGEAAQRAGDPALRSGSAEALEQVLAALGTVEALLSRQPYLLGERLTSADVHLWATLVQLDHVHRWHLDADATHRIAGHPELWSYARRLLALPEFGRHLRVPDILARHHAHCRGLEAAGAAVRIIDWQHTDPRPALPHEVGGGQRN